MRFNRRLGAIKVISFDLDDTLYSNRQVMLNTDQAMQSYFQQLFSQYQVKQVQQLPNHLFWQPYRQQVLTTDPLLTHDVTEVRRATYQLGLKQLGLAEQCALTEADKAMSHFLLHRNQVAVPAEIPEFLATLSKRYRLIAISNGNVCTQAIGLAPFFEHIFHAGQGLKQKPANDLFHHASNKLNVKPQQILHVGDCGHADIFGAQRAGCRSAWLNCYDVGKPIKVLPDIELNQVTDLAKYF